MNKLDYDLGWSTYFEISSASPSGLFLILDKQLNNISPKSVGSRHYQKNGDPLGWRVKFKDKRYLAHRIIWVITYGTIDNSLVIDHLDGNPFNNDISNLSLKTQKENSRNRRQHCNNTSGITGVRLHNVKGKMYYTAQWHSLNGATKQKSFSIDRLGEDLAKNLAAEYRKKQIDKLISEGAEYTERHGE